MVNLPEKIETTYEFCYTLRRLREQLIGLPLDRIAPPSMRYPQHITDVETPGIAISTSLIYQYDAGLRWYLGQQWEDLAAALATAHFVQPKDTDLATEVARWQVKNTGALLVLLLGAEVGASDPEYIAARSVSPIAAAENLYTERDSDRWLRAGATLAWRRNGLTFVRAQDRDLDPIKSLFQRWGKDEDRKHVYFAGTTGHPGYYTTLAVDPIKAITSLKSAGRIAEAMGAGPDDRAALAWGLLLTNRASSHPEHKKPHTGIENWPALDAAGPAAYQELLDGITDFLAPAPDLIWSTTRRYLTRWHGYYAHAALEVNLDPETGETATWPWPRAEPLILGKAHRYLIAYDDQTLPGLPAVMTEITPSVTITPTRMCIEPGENHTTSPDDYWWLPSGVDGRILARKYTGTWKALQLAAGAF